MAAPARRFVIVFLAAMSTGGAATVFESFAQVRKAMGQRDWERAIALSESILERDPTFALAWRQILNAHRNRGDLTGAWARFETLGSRFSQACLGRALFLTGSGRHAEAVLEAEACAVRHPRWLHAFRVWAEASKEAGTSGRLAERLDSSPSSAPGIHLAAVIAMTELIEREPKMVDRSRAHLERLRAIMPDDDETDEAIYYFHTLVKETESARRALVRILARAQRNRDADWILRASGRLAGLEYYDRRHEAAKALLVPIIPLDAEFGLKDGERFHRHLLGLAEAELGNFEAGLAEFEKSLRLAERPLDRGRTLNRIAQIHRYSGRLARAAASYTEAASLAQKAGNLTDEASFTTSLAYTWFELGESKRAREALAAARALLPKVPLAFHRAQILIELAGLERGLGRPAEAIALASESVQLATEVRADPATEARARLFRAELLLAPSSLAAAQADLERAEALAAQGKLARESCQATLLTGRLHLLRREFAPSLARYESAMAQAAKLASPPLRAEAHLGLSDLHWAQNRFSEALAERNKAIALFEQMRASLDNPAQAASFLARRSNLYRETARIALAMGSPEEAFAVSERGRARSLLDLLPAGGGAGEGSVEERKLMAAVTRAQDEFRTSRGTAAAAAAMRTAQEDLDRYLSSATQSWSSLETPVGAREVMAALPRDGALLQYSLGESPGVFVVTREGTRHVKLGPSRGIEELANRLRGLAGKRPQLAGRAAVIEAARAMFDAVLGPAVPMLVGKTDLAIVAEGALQAVPFEALMARDGKYAIERYRIRYAPSASSLLALERRAAERSGEPALLAFANPSIAAGAPERLRSGLEPWRLAPLPHSDEEARAAARAWAPRKAEVFSREQATEDVLRAEPLERYSILHFAVHGLLDETRPRFSALALAPSAANDGLLQMHEIRKLRLRAPLVVLSACETALGENVSGEGVMGLSHAFLSAGARGVIATLWRVDDRSTSAAMIRFHRELARPGGSSAAALRSARLALLADPATAHPFYWAGLVQIGSGR